jgi:hypothetical protein
LRVLVVGLLGAFFFFFFFFFLSIFFSFYFFSFYPLFFHLLFSHTSYFFFSSSLSASQGDGLSDIPIDEIVNIGKKVLEIVKEGTPVVNVQSDLATAIPAQATGWLDMSDWKGIKSWGPFVWSRRNGFGTETIHYEFTFDWNYGGRYNGKGSFLQEGTVGNKDIHAAWAHDMDVGLTVGAPSNVGSSAWPVAQVSFTVRMKVDTMINHEQRECKATLMGDGSGKLLYCDDYKLV